MIVYLSGKITGNPNFVSEFNHYEQLLKDMGHEVINPAKVSSGLPESFTHSEYMAVDLPLIDKCHAVAFMPNWEDSLGASIEMGYAIARGKAIMEMETE